MDLKRVSFIGDKSSDIEAGKRLGIHTHLVETGYGAVEKRTTNVPLVKKNLREAAAHLLNLQETYDP